ncbi:hypothetical protein Acr_00g0072710 [Actinidia rufa]|uniref:Uncharacterized protein n=1 Tax=Actinidia rufa TaxID=165716 RepID=A0A7J0DRX9_9ERIC|nr:hypothetical protein Acr_00g0072710 [Actinidia rufa]
MHSLLMLLEKLHKALQDLKKLQKVATGSVYKLVFNCGYSRIGNSYKRDDELRPSIFQECWLAYLQELDTIVEPPSWATIPSEVEFPDLPETRASTLKCLMLSRLEISPTDSGSQAHTLSNSAANSLALF